MADSTVQIILQAVDKASKVIQGVTGQVTKLTTATEKATKTNTTASKTVQGFGSQIGGLGKMLLGPIAGFATLTGAVMGAVGFIKGSINDWVAYNEEVRKLGIATGASTEELSRLMQAADDVGVNMGAMQTSLKLLSKNGIKPTVENVAALSDRLLAITDETKRAEEMSKLFGRGWAEVAAFVLQGSDAIKNGAAAINDNMIVTKESVQVTSSYRIAMDELGDSFTGIKNSIAQEALPPLVKWIETLNTGLSTHMSVIEQQNKLTAAWKAGLIPAGAYADIWYDLKKGVISVSEAEAKAIPYIEKGTARMKAMTVSAQDQIKWLGISVTAKEEDTEATKDATEALTLYDVQMMSSAQYSEKVISTQQIMAQSFWDTAKNLESAADAAKRMDDKLSSIPTDIGSKILKDLRALDFRAAGSVFVENLRMGVMANLAKGLITQKEAEDALKYLFIAFETVKVKAGEVSQVEAWQTVKEQIKDWGIEANDAKLVFDALLGFDGKTINFQTILNILARIQTQGTLPGTVGRGGRTLPDIRQESNGGDFIVPPGYPNDSYRIGVETGERVIVIPRGEPGNATSVINDNIDRLVAGMPMMSGAVNGTSSPVYSSTYSNSATNYNTPITVNANVGSEQDLHRLAYQIAREFNQRTNR